MVGFKGLTWCAIFVLALVFDGAKARERQLEDIFEQHSTDLNPGEDAKPVEVNNNEELTKDYTGAQLWNVDIRNQSHLLFISKMSHRRAFSVWGGSHTSVDILVLKENIENIKSVFDQNGINYTISMENVQEAIRTENPPLSEQDLELQNRKGHRLTWQQYHRLADIYGFLDYLATTYPKHCTLETIGTTQGGREIKLIKISNGKPGNKAIFIDGGIHAREWISPAVTTYIINHLAENFDVEEPEMQNIDWYFVPVLNPDGYEYSHTKDRMWRKNRRSNGICAGVDLNRNFGYHWGGKGASKYPCSETYCGTKAFSENESKAMADYILKSEANFKAYISYHSYGQYLLHPWGYDSVVPTDHRDLGRVGMEMAQAIKKTGGSEYSVGASSLLLYPAAGGSDDWAKGTAKIKFAYTVELSDTGKHGFVLPASYILPVSKESLAGLRVLVNAVAQEN